MIIPLVGQASCQGVSSAWGHQALQGWACQQSSEGSKEEPFGGSQNRQKRQRGSKHSPEAPTQDRRGREAASIPQKHPLKEGSRCVVLNWTARERSSQIITEASTQPFPGQAPQRQPEATGAETRMSKCLHLNPGSTTS